jgi:hypothetical protein
VRKRKHILIICLPLIAFILASTTLLKTEGAHPGSTGGPGDLTCAQTGCHTDAHITQDAVANNTLVFSSADTTYYPGQTYTVTIKVKGLGFTQCQKFGFEALALRDADSLNIGQFIITDAARTQLLTHLYNTDSRNSTTHKGAGTPAISPDQNEWSFTWTAPANNVGTITFYYATLAANSDNLQGGDRIFQSSFQIKPNPAIYLKEEKNEFGLNVFYNRDNRCAEVNYTMNGKKEVQLTVMDMNGKIIAKGEKKTLSGKQKEILKMGEDISSGTYFIQLTSDNRTAVKKIMVN